MEEKGTEIVKNNHILNVFIEKTTFYIIFYKLRYIYCFK